MKRFLSSLPAANVFSTLNGLDRVLFRGTLKSISYADGLGRFLSSQRVLFKDFVSYAKPFSNEIRATAEALAAEHGRPYVFVRSSAQSKEEIVGSILLESPVSEGLICVLQCIESCRGIDFRTNAKGHREPYFTQRRCCHFYFYFIDPVFGRFHIRLQWWFPFEIQLCFNGREWLARQLDREGIAYTKVANCFTHVADVARAQALLDELAAFTWHDVLDRFAQLVNPFVGEDTIFRKGYTWTTRQQEVATDVLFSSAEALSAVYPSLVRHAFTAFDSTDLLRFFSRTQTKSFPEEIEYQLKKDGRVEGLRVKHWAGPNSIKMYDKAGSVLRVETTINNPRRLRVRRPDTTGALRSQALRKGIIDLPRAVELATTANARYLDALAVVGDVRPAAVLLDPVVTRVEVNGRRYRGLRPLDPSERAIFRVLLAGQGMLNGVSNRELREALTLGQESAEERRRMSARMTRTLAMLRAHGVIEKLPKQHRYLATPKGCEVMAAALRLGSMDLRPLAI